MTKIKKVFLRSIPHFLLFLVLPLWLIGCMTVDDSHVIVRSANSGKTFANKTISVLPTKSQASLSTDSLSSFKREINKRLGAALQNKLPSSKVLDLSTVVSELNEKNGLPVFQQLVSTYENTGVIDSKKSAELGNILNSNYLFLPLLKAEKMDIWISKGMGASLELLLIDASTGKIAWGGGGEWKRGGIYGAGGASAEEAAENLVTLAFESLK